MDHSILETWIRPEHLKADAIAQHRQRFASDPARLVLLEDFLLPSVAEQLHVFLSKNAEYQPEHGLYSHDGPVSAERWSEAPEDDRFFRFSKLARTRPGAELDPETLTYLRFRAFLQSPPARDYFAEVSDLALEVAQDEIGVHAFAPGDFLRSHDDDNRNRRLAFIFYLTPGWTAAAGGALHMDAGGDVRSYVPLFNSAVAFDVEAGTTHHVSAVTDDALGARLTIGGWYHHPDDR